MISPAIAAIAIGVLSFAAFAGGFAVSDWRNGAEIQRLESDNQVLSESNKQCATDIGAVRARVKELIEAAEVRTKAAAVEMNNAHVEATVHTRKAILIKAAPIRPGEPMCDAMVREQLEYVAVRRAE